MRTTLTLDRAGRVLIPENLRRDSKRQEITLSPVRTKALLKKELGVWVYQGEAAQASVTELIDREREKRTLAQLG